MNPDEWVKQVVKQEEIDKYLIDGKDFIDEELINKQLSENKDPDKQKIRDILQKSLNIERLEPEETAALLNVTDPKMWEEMFEMALKVKRKVYDNRIVFFAPLYCANLCVNSCKYCGFRKENKEEKRRILTMDEIREETKAVVAEGHKRMIAVYGEHPSTAVDYICDSIKAIYSVKEKSKDGTVSGEIRRVNINAAPMSIADLKKLNAAGIGTYQVFQETYHKETYKKVHPAGVKANYRWRLYALHRAMEAGVDDVATGVLFGLANWRFEVMGLLYHAIDLERQFGVGPHTISFPRMTPAIGSDLSKESKFLVSDENTKKLAAILRLSVPYTGIIITAREEPEIKKEIIKVGCTQTDASSRIGIGAYTEALKKLAEHQGDQTDCKQQFTLGDTRSLDAVIREMAEMGMITSFCTAGYRCGRTGDKIMGLLKSCTEGKFCKLNAVLTFREYLEDYASAETKAVGEKVLAKELKEIEAMEFYKKGNLLEKFKENYNRICNGERDIFI
ncbi:MAG: [FeFe] hydrogenase H-cluster radical SAM maturase HydG [Bacteroidetes bacterium]|nr:[FeFe] hydrogenase H-cluster radical SAM maturase HydG [Bacteroidota bacterium]